MIWRAAAVLAVLIAIAAAAWFLFGGKGPEPAPVLDRTDAAAPAPRDEPAGTVDQRPIQGRKFAEDAPERPPRAARRGTGLLVTVVYDDKKPVAGASVFPYDPRDPQPAPPFGAGAEQTADDGTAEISMQPGQTHLLVVALGHVPVLVAVTDPKRMEIVIAGEVTLRGIVTVDGSAPPAVLWLAVRGYDDPTDRWPEGAREIAARRRFGDMRLPFRTDKAGAFAVRGIALGSAVAIEIPAEYAFADAPGREMPVVANSQPLTIALRTLNTITGRVAGRLVNPNTGNSSADSHTARIDIRYALLVPGRPEITGSVSAQRGNFRIPFAEPELAGARLEAWDLDTQRLLARHDVDERIMGSFDVGEIDVGTRHRTVLFRILDRAGRPIRKGRVFVEGHVSGPSDDEGRAPVVVLEGMRTAVAGAPGFRTTVVPLPEKLPEAMDVRLDDAITLIVRVRHEDPQVPLEGLRVAVTQNVQNVVAAAEGNPDFGEVRMTRPGGSFGMGVSGASTSQQTNQYEVQPGKDVVVGGFAPNEGIRVAITDQYGSSLLDENIKLPETDAKAIEMIVRSTPRRLEGTVLDHTGAPLLGADVQLLGSGFATFTATTDSTGHFELAAVYSAEPELSVSARGHLPANVKASPAGEPITVRLERARQLAVDLTGGTGKFDGKVTFEVDGTTHHAGARSDRVFWFDAIPRKPGTLRATSGSKTTSVQIGAEDTRVQLPRPE